MGEDVRAIIDAVPASIAYVDAEQRYQLVNTAYRAWFGDVAGTLLADTSNYPLIRPHVERALQGTRVTFEACIPCADGSKRWMRSDYVPDVVDGIVRGFVAQIVDVDDRKLAEQRLALLEETSTALAATVDHDSTMRAIVSAAVPALAEWCSIYVDRFGVFAPAEVAHVPTMTTEQAWQLARAFTPDPNTHTQAFEQGDAIVVPLATHDRRFGVLVFGATSRRWSDDDLKIADELGRRSSTALAVARLFDQQRRANERLRDLDRRKNEFLAIVGHELRNPLAPIITALDLMAYRGLTGCDRERDVIRRQALHMSRLVDDLLDVSRVTRGKIELNKERVELRTVIDKAIERTSPLLEQRSHQLTVDLPRDLFVDADPVRLTQAIENLLMNAAKYTHSRGHIAIIAARRDQSLFISVSDDGSGIAPERMADIFEPFVQGERSLARPEGGLGLGLVLVRSLTELHGGKVSVTSEGLGKGAQFTLELPVFQEPEGAARQRPSHELGIGTQLLVVDSNVGAADSLAQLLRELGYEVAVAHDAPAALALADQFRPAMAVIDIGLPVMDGYELARHLRSRTLSPPRLVAVTGYGERADLTRSRDAGFDVQLGKPVDFDKLVSVLGQLGQG